MRAKLQFYKEKCILFEYKVGFKPPSIVILSIYLKTTDMED